MIRPAHVDKRPSAAALLAAALAAVSLSGSGCSSQPDHERAAESRPPLAVQVAAVVTADAADTVEAGGTVQARSTATLAARVLAQVHEVRAAPGDRVRQGQVVVVLDGRDLVAGARSASAAVDQTRLGAEAAREELRAAGAALALARATRDRIAALHVKRSATPQELDEATAAFEVAHARSAAAEARVQESGAGVARAVAAAEGAAATASFVEIRAPFDGLVTEKLVEPGNMAAPGAPLLRMEDTRAFRLDVRVDASHASAITPGGQVEVALDGPDPQPVRAVGTVSEVSRAIDVDTRAFLVKITLPDTPGLRSGVFGRARFPGPRREALSVPANAVQHQGQVRSVFVVADGVARLRLIRLQGTEVQAGLAVGELVVVAPPAGLTDGRRVTVEGGP